MDCATDDAELENPRFHLLLVDSDPEKLARMAGAIEQVGAPLELSVVSSVGLALSTGWLLSVDAALVEFTGSMADVSDCRALARATGGAAIFWLLGNHDIVAVERAVEAGISGAFYRDQVEPAEAFLRSITRLARESTASLDWGTVAP